MKREHGTITAWRETFGFIHADGVGNDVFVHRSELRSIPRTESYVGMRVTFDRVPGRDGRNKAVDVERE